MKDLLYTGFPYIYLYCSRGVTKIDNKFQKMSLSGKMLIALLAVIVCSHSMAEVYKVGDSSGWTSLTPPDYKAWAASKTFRVNDTIGTYGLKSQFSYMFCILEKTKDIP